mmetsp:Transcript_621/g.4222  ORF Transcript_621/g.4222 Transcript_621/m.4222 type:complete len:237 (+) Transcript_621:661-1371(+)
MMQCHSVIRNAPNKLYRFCCSTCHLPSLSFLFLVARANAWNATRAPAATVLPTTGMATLKAFPAVWAAALVTCRTVSPAAFPMGPLATSQAILAGMGGLLSAFLSVSSTLLSTQSTAFPAPFFLPRLRSSLSSASFIRTASRYTLECRIGGRFGSPAPSSCMLAVDGSVPSLDEEGGLDARRMTYPTCPSLSCVVPRTRRIILLPSIVVRPTRISTCGMDLSSIRSPLATSEESHN